MPEEEDLMWIAEEGICAELPDGWGTEESAEDGEVVYVNLKTGERTFVHPCDDYYKQLVMQERKKRGNKLGKKAGGPQPSANKGFPGQQPQVVQPIAKAAPADPLLKMQQEK